jgi:hypothetical protein
MFTGRSETWARVVVYALQITRPERAAVPAAHGKLAEKVSTVEVQPSYRQTRQGS